MYRCPPSGRGSYVFCSEIFSDFYEVSKNIFYIISNISKFHDEDLQDWCNLALLDYPYRFYLGKIMLKYEYHLRSSGFWGMFICSSPSHHCICIALYVLKLQEIWL